MKPWIGAVAAAAAIFAVPATALAAPEDPALLKFKLDNSSQYDDFENLGFDMDHAVENGEGDDIIVSAWVDDEQLKLARAHGYEDVGVVHSKENFAAIRAESLANKLAEIDAKKALEENAAGRKGASAAAGSIRAQRADFYENNVGKFLSIEANVDGVTYTGANQNVYNGPTVMAEWFDAAGNKLGEGALAPYTDPDVTPGLLPVPLPDLPDRQQGRHHGRGRVDQGRVQQRRRRHARRQGMDLEEPAAELRDLQVRLRDALLRLA